MSGQPICLIVRGAELYDPEPRGRQDILILFDRIAKIATRIEDDESFLPCRVIDAQGLMAAPGLVDGHVHILGGGGEGGPTTRAPEITVDHIVTGGITTVLGLLGFDGMTRSVISLLAKARALEAEGLSTYIYTGAYQIPPQTVTGQVEQDIVLIDKVLGVGEIALSDQRSSAPQELELARLAAQARVAGILSNKPGLIHLHMGDGRRGLSPIFRILEDTDLPAGQFYPTHINRQPWLLEQSARLARAGAFVDLTAGVSPELDEPDATPPATALKRLLQQGAPAERITMSSDGNGSLPEFDTGGKLVRISVGSVHLLWQKLTSMVTEANLPLPLALRVGSTHPAQALKLYPRKGTLRVGSDADLILFDRDFLLQKVIAKGRLLVDDGRSLVQATMQTPDDERQPLARSPKHFRL